ncbi:DUF4105 domain-containing protein [Neotabrizicola sp. VNH66]|uniref:Lnb N-terminal periplasmic domain-containing protein n=1 Tax=Neotabrizicola sp. VNH66 TaxID=3400918 RepID=UPI003C0C9FE8
MVLALLFWALLVLGTVWAGLALWVQFPGGRPVVLAGLLALVAGIVWLRLGPGWGWTGLAVAALALGGWYASLTPRQDRDWADDVARIVRGTVDGDRVTLENVRAFRWDTADHASVQNWTTRTVDLSRLEGADMITSVWGNPDIAHLLVSFRFTDGPPVTFSVEIRREKDEKFSPLGGFFRQFELSLIAADEADIVQWRAVPRGEEVRVYPLTLTPGQLRQVFLGYVDLGNALNERPRWYNTVTSNCTTVVWGLSRVLSPDLPLDRSLLLSGYLPEYLDRFGALAGTGTLAEKRARALISPRAREMPPGEDFSRWIRTP